MTNIHHTKAAELLRQGARVMVTTATTGPDAYKYGLTTGQSLTAHGFSQLKPNLRPVDPPLIPGAEPLSYEWSGK